MAVQTTTGEQSRIGWDFVPMYVISAIVSIAVGLHGMRVMAEWVAKWMGLKGPSEVGVVINRKYGIQHHPTRHTVAGIFTGLGNWFVLRRYMNGIPGAGTWMLATIFGWLVGSYVPHHETTGHQGIKVGAMTGAVSGLWQWLILREQKARNPGLWILANTVGTSAGYTLGFNVEKSSGLLAASAVAAIVSGLITAFPLRWLLESRDPEAAANGQFHV